MSLPSKISALETQLAAKRARYAELTELIPKLEAEKRGLSHRPGRRKDMGEISELEREIESARRECEASSSLPPVRVVGADARSTDWYFVKNTRKSIVLRNRHGDFKFGMDGKLRLIGVVHPADLARILDGTISNNQTREQYDSETAEIARQD